MIYILNMILGGRRQNWSANCSRNSVPVFSSTSRKMKNGEKPGLKMSSKTVRSRLHKFQSAVLVDINQSEAT